ncbi:GRIP and coiled-coil domain-containing protein 2-like, partial [Liolophura sinensis]|uniref:GRIP and coiled-coil domain-containing protein 2-like n=1 Tax=Liolophura sinensis TaxID=3198878 RepID=UPI0031587A10
MSQHQFSAQALLDAKNQMLLLQDKLNQKDQKILELQRDVAHRSEVAITRQHLDRVEIEKVQLRSMLSELKAENKRLQCAIEGYQVELRSLQEGRDELQSLTSDLDMLIQDRERYRKEAETVADLLRQNNSHLAETQSKVTDYEHLVAELTQKYEQSDMCLKSTMQDLDMLKLENGRLRQKLDSFHGDLEFCKEEIPSIHHEFLKASSLVAAVDLSEPKSVSNESIEVSVIESDGVSLVKMHEDSENSPADTSLSLQNSATQSDNNESDNIVTSSSPPQCATAEVFNTTNVPNKEDSTLKSAVISDIELRLSELEALNDRLKTEKDQLLQDFEDLTNNIELLKLAEEEKEVERKKLQEQVEILTMEVHTLNLSLNAKTKELEDTTILSDKLKMEIVGDGQTEILSKKLQEEEQEREAVIAQLSQIRALLSSETELPEDWNTYEIFASFIGAKTEEVTKLAAEKTEMECVTAELETQVQKLKSEIACSKNVREELEEMTRKFDNILTENTELLNKKETVSEELVRVQTQHMEALNELSQIQALVSSETEFPKDLNTYEIFASFIAAKTEEVTKLAAEKTEMEHVTAELETQVQKLKSEIASSKNVREELEEMTRKFDNMLTENTALLNEKSTVSEELVRVQTQHMEALNELSQIQALVSSETEFPKDLNTYEIFALFTAAKTEEVTKLAAEKTEMERVTAELETQVQKLKSEIACSKNVREELEEMTRKFDNILTENTALLNEKSTVSEELVRVQTQHMEALNEFSQIQALVSSETEFPKDLNTYEIFASFIAAKTEEVTKQAAEKTEMERVSAELETQVQKLKSEIACSKNVREELEEMTRKFDNMLTENTALLNEKETVSEELVRVQTQHMEALNELSQIRALLSSETELPED